MNQNSIIDFTKRVKMKLQYITENINLTLHAKINTS